MQTPRLTVREVRARPVSVPVDPPLETAGGMISAATGIGLGWNEEAVDRLLAG